MIGSRKLFGLMLMVLTVPIQACLVGCGGDDAPAGPSARSTPLVESQFESGLDDWDAGTHATLFGTVVWLDREDGVVKLDAVGFDGTPNAWISKEVDLPASAKTLRTSTSAHDRGSGGTSLRIRIVDEASTSHLIQDWDYMDTGSEGFDFTAQSFDISAYAGQTVTIFFEIGDDDGGGNNQRYIDFVEIHD